MSESTVTLGEIYKAQKAIRPFVHRTPLVFSTGISIRCGASVYLKLETVHDIGAFKIRGATNRLRNLSAEERGAAMYESQKAGRPVQVAELETLADNLGGGIGLDNRYTFNMVQTYVDDLILVNEDQIASAIKYTLEQEKIVIEGAASVGIAALMNNLVKDIGREVVTVISSRNINMDVLHQILCHNGH